MLSFLRSVEDELSMWYYKVNCKFEFSATPEEIVADAVAAFESGDNATIQEALLAPVEEIFASESFQTDVFSGGDTTQFDENIATLEIIDRAKPLQYQQALLQNHYDPYAKSLTDYCAYLTRLDTNEDSKSARH